VGNILQVNLLGSGHQVDHHDFHIMYLHCTILYGQRGLTIGRMLWASWGQAGLKGVAMIYGLASMRNCHHNTWSSLGVGCHHNIGLGQDVGITIVYGPARVCSLTIIYSPAWV